MNRSLSLELVKLRAVQQDYATPNFCFRSFVKADVHPLLGASTNPRFNQFLLWAPPQNVEDAMVQARKLLREDSLNTSVTTSIVEKATGKWAGFLRWLPFRDGLTISLWLHPDFWGNNASQELLECIFEMTFDITMLDNLYAMTQPQHKGSVKAVLGKGMERIDAMELTHDDGTPRLVDIYRLQRQHWAGKVPLVIF